MTGYKNHRWNKKMTIAEMLPLMSDAEIAKNARRGGPVAIAEYERRQSGMTRYADRIMPDPELDIGV